MSRYSVGRPEFHRAGRGGMLRAAIFGISDGLMTNMALVLGVAAGDAKPALIRLAGMSAMAAGSVSMAAGEYVSNRVASELATRDIEIEREELNIDPDGELQELVELYEKKGMTHEVAHQAAVAVMSDPNQALLAHAKEELGLDGVDSDRSGAYIAGSASFLAFGTGALLPLVPWFFAGGVGAVITSAALGVLGALSTGMVSAMITGNSLRRAAFRQLRVVIISTLVTVLIGRVVGLGSLG